VIAADRSDCCRCTDQVRFQAARCETSEPSSANARSCSDVPFSSGSRQFHPVLREQQPSFPVGAINRDCRLAEAFFGFIGNLSRLLSATENDLGEPISAVAVRARRAIRSYGKPFQPAWRA
jgi:hypothetical protein